MRALIAGLLLLTASAGALAQTLNPIADAFVRGGTWAGSNFGTATRLYTQTSNQANSNHDTYLKFDTASVSSISSALLRVKASVSNSIGMSAYAVVNTTWGETTITWNNKPARGSVLASVTVTGSTFVYYVFDVTAYVVAEKAAGRNVVSFALHNPSNSSQAIWMDSRENASGPPELVLTVNSSVAQLYFVHVDHLNTPRLVTNAAGQSVWRWDQQEPFGVNVPGENPSGLGAFEFPLRFPGQYADKETNLHYNFFRDYDSGIGRYVQSDPIGLAGGINTYAYVSSNPLFNRDPLGLSSHGCGAGPAYRGIPNLWFRECCDAHDACYENCKDLPPKSQCDSTFCGCVFSKCTGWANSATCRALAGSYCAAGTQSGQSQRSFDESREKCKRTPLACTTAGQS